MNPQDFVISALQDPDFLNISFTLEGISINGKTISHFLLWELKLDKGHPREFLEFDETRGLPPRGHGLPWLSVIADPGIDFVALYTSSLPGVYNKKGLNQIVLQCIPNLGDYKWSAYVLHECTHAYLRIYDLDKTIDTEVAAWLMMVLYHYKKEPKKIIDAYWPQLYCVWDVLLEKCYMEALNLILSLGMDKRSCILTNNDVKHLQEAICEVKSYRDRAECKARLRQ